MKKFSSSSGFTTFSSLRSGLHRRSSHERGFTLIELLIVLAVIGVLATGVLIAINPQEKIAKAKDSTKKTVVSQLANALQSYYVLKGGQYPLPSATWINTLVTNGDLKNVPPSVTSSCATNNQNGYCYELRDNGAQADVYTTLETSQHPDGTTPFFFWSSATGENGTSYSVTPDITGIFEFTPGEGSTLTQGLVGWWKMNGNADDSSGSGNNGTMSVSPPTLAPDKNGQPDSAYSFNGSNNYILVGDTSAFKRMHGALDPTGFQFTFGTWIQRLAGGPDGYIFSTVNHAYTSTGVYIYLNGGISIRMGIAGGSGTEVFAANDILTIPADGLFHLLVWTYNQALGSGNSKLYLDDQLRHTGNKSTGTVSTANSTYSSYIGAAGGGGVIPNSILDDVRIYNRALSAGEVQNLFSAGPQ